MNRDFRFRRRMSWPLSAKHAELDSRQARMAVSDTSAQRAYSAICRLQISTRPPPPSLKVVSPGRT
jgi:hypothetical protein